MLAAPLGAAISAARAQIPPLRGLAAQIGLYYGSDSDETIAVAPESYASIFAQQCALLAPNMGWRRVAGNPGDDEPVWEDPNVGFALRNGMKLTGAHLLWYLSLPGWFGSIGAGAPARALADQHTRQMVQHYRGQVFSWNVVNEEIDTQNGDSRGMRESLLASQLGPDFIAHAFQTAAQAGSDALLTYNDAHFEMDDAFDAARRDALLGLLDRLQRAGAPISAVGLQAHLLLDGTPFNPAIYRRFLRDIASRGLRILITELDVSDVPLVGSIGQRDQAVAAMYSTFLETALDEPAVAQVVTWGLSDLYTWINPQTGSYDVRADGLPARPLPFDDQFQPKPAFAAIAAAFASAPPRKMP